MKAGDLVSWKPSSTKFISGYNLNPGLLISIKKDPGWVELQASVLWPGGRITKQSIKNLEVFSEER